MVKIAFFCLILMFVGACSDKQQDSAHQTQSKENTSVIKGTILPIEPDSTPTADKILPNTPATNVNVDQQLNSDIGGAFAKPDSENNALFEDIINDIVDEEKIIDFSTEISDNERLIVQETCKKIDKKLASVTLDACLSSNLRPSNFSSTKDTSILITEFPPVANKEPLGKILVIGGTHGDELTSISVVFKWIKILQKYHSGLFHWHIAPLMNPDGALLPKATRPNANLVDLNRNMPTPDWHRLSSDRWKKIGNDSRKNPGTSPASEPETQWLIHEIETFKPDAIVSIHAPYGILDFDAPDLTTAPKHFGRLRLNLLGTYPGSLGNYAGIHRDIPVLTLELPHAWVMPKDYEVNEIWTDMIGWLKIQLAHN